MRSIFLAGAAAISLIAAPTVLMAQDSSQPSNPGAATPADPPMGTELGASQPSGPPVGGGHAATPQAGAPYAMTAAQQQAHDTWTPEKRADYDAWPADTQTYYWSLNDQQQQGYWALTPDQRGMIYKMSPDQRAKAWQSIAAQLNGQTPATPPDQANPPGLGMPTNGVPDPQVAAQSAPPAMPADPGYQGGPYKGALTPPPATAMNKSYPRCTRTVQDSCRNPGGV